MTLEKGVLENIKEGACKAMDDAYEASQRIENAGEFAYAMASDVAKAFKEAGSDELSENTSENLKKELEIVISNYMNASLMRIKEKCIDYISNDVDNITMRNCIL